MNVLKEKVENTSDRTKVVMSSMTMSDDLEKRGGLRKNSSTLHLAKKIRKFKCAWCGVSYSSIQAQSKFCCHEHKLKDYRARKALKKKKRLTDLIRKGKNFRPHRVHLARFRIAQLRERHLLSPQAHVPVVGEQAD